MNHEQAIELLSASLDRQLTPTEREHLDTWLAADPEHRALAEGLQQQNADLKTTFEPRREAVAQVVAKATASLTTNQPTSPTAMHNKGWQKWFSPIPAGIAAAIVIGLSLWAFRGRNTPTSIGTPSDSSFTEVASTIGLKPRPKPAEPKTPVLAVGDRVTTQAGEKRRLTLPDGSLLYVNQNTQAEIISPRQVKLTTGEVFVEVVPGKSDDAKFVVETPARSVTALGTKFAVSAEKVGTAILVTQGKVSVSDLADPIASGEQLTANGKKAIQAPRGACAVEWTRDLMIAAEAPLVPAGKHSGGSLVALDPYGQEAKLKLVKFHVDVHIEEGFARTTIDQTFFNNENQQLEGTFYFPLPPDASLNRLAMYVEGNRMEGGMAERDHARNVYETIRHQRRDPALLEWVDGSVFKMRVFPLPAREEKRIVLSYTQKLNNTYGRSTYRFPSGHSLSNVEQWSFHGTLKNADDWSVASPSHPTMKISTVGKDVELSDKAANIRIDRDVVLELADHHQGAVAPESNEWTHFTQDGQRYLMMRYKPDLPMAQRRERRDWVFLFESSGARDPLVARTQVEVIRALLNHAEHEDTFTVLTVGTRIRSFTTARAPVVGNDGKTTTEFYRQMPSLVPATGENVAKAIQWLEQTHLIGALNIEAGFDHAVSFLRGARNPHIVHVGSGIASYGEQRPDLLINKLPQGTKYVGVAVGRRFSTTLMKTAAEKTGGLFTQINPDEPIAWKGFELASMLNAPRLLNVKLAVPGMDNVRLLPFSASVAHGEELVAIARITDGQPAAVNVTGLVDGEPFQRTLAVKNLKEGAGHLPRSWAKLEIDRLLAENSAEHRYTITELSKAMYVMTPYTSLLVLENEQMYKDFKVDRGRKDHWAMYPAPDKIPVVYVPDPNTPWATRGSVIGQKPHENQVLNTIYTRVPPSVLQGPNLPNQQNTVQTAGERFGSEVAWSEVGVELWDSDGEEVEELLKEKEVPLKAENDFKEAFGKERLQQSSKERGTDLYRRSGAARDKLELRFKSLNNQFGMEKRVEQLQRMQRQVPETWSLQVDGRKREDEVRKLSRLSSRLGNRDETRGFSLEKRLRQVEERVDRFNRSSISAASGNLPELKQRLQDLSSNLGDQIELSGLGLQSRPRQRGSQTKTSGESNEYFMDGTVVPEPKLAIRLSRTDAMNDLEPKPVVTLTNDDPGVDDFEALQDVQFSVQVSEPAYYSRPSFVFSERLFRDLASFAPGMSSLPADVKATVEAESAPRFGTRRGSIDPAAKKLIDSARSTMGWRTTLVPQPDGSKLSILHDGMGRYAYERTVMFGLKEYVKCDGQTLWHSYPEIGLGAKRAVSRFHRAEFVNLVPGTIPPAEDLNYGADVQFIAPNQVAIVPHHPLDEDGNVKPWREMRFVFKNERFAETYTVRQPKNQASAKVLYENDGTIQLWDSANKKLAEAKVDWKSAQEPKWTVDHANLLVLPMPLRDRQHVYPKIGLDPNYNLGDSTNECWRYLSHDDLLELLACEFGMGSSAISTITWHLYQEHNDRRVGLDVINASLNYSPRNGDPLQAEAKVIADPLARYLYREFDQDTRDWNKKFGFALPAQLKDDFLSRLSMLRVIFDRFTGGYTNHPWWGIRESEVRRSLAYVKQHPESSLAWAAMGLISDHTSIASLEAAKAETWGILADKSAFPYAARYEQARLLDRAGQGPEAMKKFQELFREALSVGILPSVDEHFRIVLSRSSTSEWPALMKEMANKCAKNKARPVVVLLAWQCWQLGDVALSDTILEAALAGAPEDELPMVSMWGVQFLNATNRYDRADELMKPLLTNKQTVSAPIVWRIASQVAGNRNDQVRSIEYLEQALEIEFARLPDSFDINPIRNDYGRLLNHYEWLADAATKLSVPAPKNLPTRLVKAVDRWRQMDPEADNICHRSGAVLRKIGGDEATSLAWDYETTPLALKPNESGPWESLASRLRIEGDWKLADRAYEMAYLAEPTNAQLLWNRAQHLKDKGQIAESQRVLRQLADGQWQDRFSGLVGMAKSSLGMR